MSDSAPDKMPRLAKTVGANVRRYRLERGLTQRELAERTGLKADYVSKLERGKCNAHLSRVEYLKRFKAEQSRKLLALGRPVGDSCICATAGKDYMHPENVSRSLRRFVEANGLSKATPHVLRHTYCTLLFAAGVDLKTAQYLMGHEDVLTTLRIYAHYLEGKGAEAAKAVGAMMDSLPATNIVLLDKPQGRWGISARAV